MMKLAAYALVFLLAGCSPSEEVSNDGDGEAAVRLPPPRPYDERFDVKEEGGQEVVDFLTWAYAGGPDTGELAALRAVDPNVLQELLLEAYRESANTAERWDVIYVATTLRMIEMLLLFEAVLNADPPEELMEEFEPHDGRLTDELKVYVLTVQGVWDLYEETENEDARELLLVAAAHSLEPVRGFTVTRVASSDDEALKDDVRAQLPEDEQHLL